MARAENDTQAALERTLERMGDPQQLTKELQDSVGTLDRWTGRLDALLFRPRGRSHWGHALRITIYFGGLFVAVLLILLVWRLSQFEVAKSVAELRFIGSFALCWVANTFVLALVSSKVLEIFEQEHWTWSRGLAATLFVVVAAGQVLVEGWLFMFLVTGSVESCQQTLPYWGALAVAVAVGLVVVCWLSAGELRGLKEWRELEIDS